MSSRSVQRDRPTSDICFSKIGFLAYTIVTVSTVLQGWNVKSQKIEVVLAAAEKYLGIRDLTSEELQGVLNGGVLSFPYVGLR